MKRFLLKIWRGWKRFARAFATIQAEIIIFLFYFLVFVPFGLALKIFGFDPLRLRFKGTTNWQKVKIGPFDRERASHQS